MTRLYHHVLPIRWIREKPWFRKRTLSDTGRGVLTSAVAAWALTALGLSCGPAPESRCFDPDTVAYVGDRRITDAELDAAWRERKPAEYARAQQSVYQMRRAVLDDLIGDVLVADEVTRHNRPHSELVTLAVESGVVAAPPPATEAEIAALYEQSGAAEYGIGLETLRPEFVRALEEGRAIDTANHYREYLRANRDVRVFFDAPRTVIPVAPFDPVRGPADAPIRIVEFSDFHCLFCRQTRPALRRLMDEYVDEVQWTWKDYPLGSTTAAEAAACAHDQGRFWQYHDALFARQGETDLENNLVLLGLARELGLEETEFTACLAEGRHLGDIASDAAAGVAAGVEGTPTLFFNGRIVVGAQSFEAYERVLVEELRLASTRTEGGKQK